MYDGMPLSQLEAVETIPQGSIFPMVAGDGSGTKKVTIESLVKETGNALKIGNLEELQTENKENLVAAINEATQSGGSAVSVDILDSKEEIEANTEAGKAAGASAVKEMFSELNDNLQDTGWVLLNDSWGCYYRLKNGYITIKISTAFSTVIDTNEKQIGTIPLTQYGISVPQILAPEAQGNGYLVFQPTGALLFRPKTSARYYYVEFVVPYDLKTN